jgi:outer membrane protein OmpA-like peptidoglycan-associated protein
MNLHKLTVVAACLLVIQFSYAQTSRVLVHFAFDKSDINNADLSALQDFKTAHPDIAGITIDGYADTTGTDNYNYALSVRRCDAVKQALSYDESITEVLMRIGAHGEKNLLYQTNPENRVVIVAINDKKVEEKRIKDSIAAAALEKAKADSILKQQQAAAQAKPVAQPKNNPKPAMPKVLDDDVSGLLKLLQDSKAGESIILNEIHFEEGRHVLKKSSKPALNAMLQALKAMPSLQLQIQGHMCCDDALKTDGFDLDTKEFMLSNNRAKAVYDFFVQNGIDASRLTYKGYGTRKRLVYPEKTDTDRDKNRRVEFLIIKK